MTTAGKIVTFYSWKGGAGRTMALANIGTHLARSGHDVLLVDWDLEAPGLDRYFTNRDARERVKVQSPTNNSGLLGLLSEAATSQNRGNTSIVWQDRLATIEIPPIERSARHTNPPSPGRLQLLPSGHEAANYADLLHAFSWSVFFAEHGGGIWLEQLRSEFAKNYDFVLVDSRTGLTDSGGVCTIQMPDILILVFTSNDESLEGGLKVVQAAQIARANYAFERSPLLVLPLLSRWDGDSEVDLAAEWMKWFDDQLKPHTSSWLPEQFSAADFLERSRVPHVARFSFGEPLPVLSHSLTDSNLPGLAYDVVCRMLASNFVDAGKIIDPSYVPPAYTAGYATDDEIAALALASDATALHQEIGRIARSKGPESVELGVFLNRAASVLRTIARFSEAEPLSRRALAIDEKSYGPDHPKVATDLINLASLLRDTNRFSEAEPLVRRALTIDEKSFGPDHPEVATDLNNLAGLLRDTNRISEAEQLFRRALAINESNYGPNHPSVAIRLNNLAGLLCETNRLSEAESLYWRALAITEEHYGPDNPSVAIRLNNLAALLRDTDRVLEAEALYRRALAIDEKCYGPDHPEVATDLNNLAELLLGADRLPEAEPLLRRALAIFERSFGPDHPKVAVSLANLASLLCQTNRILEAEPLYRHALAIDEKSYGSDHPEVATDLNNLAGLLSVTNRLSEAEPLYRRAVAISEKSYGPNHPSVLAFRRNLEVAVRDQGKG